MFVFMIIIHLLLDIFLDIIRHTYPFPHKLQFQDNLNVKFRRKNLITLTLNIQKLQIN